MLPAQRRQRREGPFRRPTTRRSRDAGGLNEDFALLARRSERGV